MPDDPVADPDALQIESFLSPLFAQWAYLLWRAGRSDALVVDPGLRTDELLGALNERGLRPSAILNTHGHCDHIAGNEALKGAYPDAPLLIGRNDAHMLVDPMANLSGLFGAPTTSPPADRLLDDGERLELAGIDLEVREIPGHSPGSVIFVIDREDPPMVLGGDVLFRGSVGRVDFPGCDGPRLIEGVRARLLTLPDATRVFPGHGPSTTVGLEKSSNPYVGRDAPAEPFG